MYSTGKTGRLSRRLCGAEVEGLRHRHTAGPGRGGSVRRRAVEVGGQHSDQHNHRTDAELNSVTFENNAEPLTCLVMESMRRTYKSCSVLIPADRQRETESGG